MIKIWEKTVGHTDTWIKTQSFLKRMKESFITSFEGSLEKWEGYCKKIASSKFLMGEGTSSFKIWTHWAIKAETVARILQGGFTFGDRAVPEEAHIKQQKSFEKHLLNKTFESMEKSERQAYLPLFVEDLWGKNPAMATSITEYGLRDPFHQASFKSFVMNELKNNKTY